jgi:hydrogenase maturation protease
MSHVSWLNALQTSLSSAERVAVLGIGNVLRGDDGVGVFVARTLQLDRCLPHDWLVLECGAVPEACTGVVRRFAPDLIVLIDAVDMAAPPGTIAWFDTWSSPGISAASTHGVSLDLLADFLRSDVHCRSGLLGIQPATLGFGEGLSKYGRAAVSAAVAGLAQAARGEPTSTASR